jgi:hypothetical protein
MKHYLFFILFVLSQKLLAQSPYKNVKISNNQGQNEPSIVINPQNPQQILAGSNLDFYFYSHDGGETWERNQLESTHGVYGDPVVACDKFGHFYYFHLSNDAWWLDRLVCQKSIDGGVTFNNGSFTGLVEGKEQDKEWVAIDHSRDIMYMTWTEFDEYGSGSTEKKSRIRFSRSNDYGMSWTEAITLSDTTGGCKDDDNTLEGAVPAVGANGELYVVWAGHKKMWFKRSYDNGNSWEEKEKVIGKLDEGWDFSVPYVNRCNGLPFTLCDTSNSQYRGTIYVNYTDQKNGDTDVWLIKSTDGGDNWTVPKRVNTDTTDAHQYFSNMAIDPITGYLYCVFYDRRNYVGESGKLTDVYLAYSEDGGESFVDFRISEKPFNANKNVFFGDYTDISAYNGIVRPIWTSLTFYGSRYINTAIIDEILPAQDQHFFTNQTVVYPNPTVHSAFYSFKLKKTQIVHLELFDINGKLIKTIINNTAYPAGKHSIPIDLSELNLQPAIYYLRYKTGRKQEVKKLVVESQMKHP